MSHTTSPPTSPERPLRRRADGLNRGSRRSRVRRARSSCPRRRLLARYSNRADDPREVIAQPGFAESVLVVDRSARTASDARLVAHLGADEPSTNAALVCSLYLEQARLGTGVCRRVTGDDLECEPFAGGPEEDAAERLAGCATAPVDRRGFRYRIEPLPSGGSRGTLAQLRWCSRPCMHAKPRPVSVREVVAHLEHYEPVRTLTRRALRRHRRGGLSITVIRAELERLQDSPIVLNRRLREAVLEVVRSQQLSMSEIATRCGRVKVDRRGHASGETSWLARRIGVLPESGQATPTPWVHSDVLALIARRGLGISPRDVEADDEGASPGDPGSA